MNLWEAMGDNVDERLGPHSSHLFANDVARITTRADLINELHKILDRTPAYRSGQIADCLARIAEAGSFQSDDWLILLLHGYGHGHDDCRVASQTTFMVTAYALKKLDSSAIDSISHKLRAMKPANMWDRNENLLVLDRLLMAYDAARSGPIYRLL